MNLPLCRSFEIPVHHGDVVREYTYDKGAEIVLLSKALLQQVAQSKQMSSLV
jgi:hypothetical protein